MRVGDALFPSYFVEDLFVFDTRGRTNGHAVTRFDISDRRRAATPPGDDKVVGFVAVVVIHRRRRRRCHRRDSNALAVIIN